MRALAAGARGGASVGQAPMTGLSAPLTRLLARG
jgi:hypothetical protein